MILVGGLLPLTFPGGFAVLIVHLIYRFLTETSPKTDWLMQVLKILPLWPYALLVYLSGFFLGGSLWQNFEVCHNKMQERVGNRPSQRHGLYICFICIMSDRFPFFFFFFFFFFLLIFFFFIFLLILFFF